MEGTSEQDIRKKSFLHELISLSPLPSWELFQTYRSSNLCNIITIPIEWNFYKA